MTIGAEGEVTGPASWHQAGVEVGLGSGESSGRFKNVGVDAVRAQVGDIGEAVVRRKIHRVGVRILLTGRVPAPAGVLREEGVSGEAAIGLDGQR